MKRGECLIFFMNHTNLAYYLLFRYRILRKQCKKELMDMADVICCTCISVWDTRLARMRFSSILIDESMQVTNHYK